MREAYKQWDKSKDGFLSEGQLQQHMEEIYSFLDRSAPAVQLMLAAADVKSNGKVAFAEFLVTCLEAKMKLSKEKAVSLAEMIDQIRSSLADKQQYVKCF